MAVTNWVGGDGTGTQQTDWTRAANWDNGVPGSGDDAVIGNVTYDPTIPDGTDPTLGSIQVATGGQLTAGNNVITLDDVDGSGLAFYLSGTGAFVKGTSTITFTGTSTQYIAINTSNANRTFYNVTVNKSGSGDVYIYQSRDGSSNEPLVISNNLTVSARGFSTANDSSSPSTYFDLTVEGDCTVSGGTLEGNAASGATVRLKSLTVSSGTYSATGGETIITGETGAGRAVDIVGTFTHNSGTLSIQTPADTLLRWPSSSSAHHLRINDASCIARPTGDNKPLIGGNLTISAGEFNTLEGGQNHALTVTGATSVTGTLTCNDSTVSLGSGLTSAYGLTVNTNGTFAGGSGSHTIGSIKVSNSAAAVCTLSTSTTVINSENDSDNRNINLAGTDSVFTSNGVCTMTFAGATRANRLGGTLTFGGTLKINNASLAFTAAGPIQAATLTITAGTFDTGSDQALTVTGEVNVAGTLTCNSSVCSFGSLDSTGLTNLADDSGSTLITSENSDGLSIVAGTFGTCVPAKIKHNNGTVTFNNHSDPATHAAIVCGNSNATDGLYNVIIDGANTIVDTYDPGGAGQECKIHNNFTVTNGSFQVNGASNPFDVGGDVLVSAGKMFGDGAAPTGAMSFGSLTIASGAEFKATSATTTINLDFRYEDGANFTHNSGTVTFAGATDADLEMEGGHSGRKTPTNPLKFHNLISAKTGNYLNLYVDFTVESTFTITTDSTYGVSVRQPVYITMGTTTTQGTIAGPSSGTDNLYFATEATTSKILAANTDGLYPWIKTGNDWGWSAGNGGTINLENGDYQTTLNTETGYHEI